MTFATLCLLIHSVARADDPASPVPVQAGATRLSGGAISSLTVNEEGVKTLGPPSINEFGEVAFAGVDDNDEPAVLYTTRATGGTLITLHGSKVAGLTSVVTSNDGVIAALGKGNAQKQDVYVWKLSAAGPPLTINGSNFGDLAIDGAGNVAFQGAVDDASPQALYSLSPTGGGVLLTIRGNWFGGDPGASPGGAVAASGNFDEAGPLGLFVWQQADGPFKFSVAPDGVATLGSPAVNDSGLSLLTADNGRLFRVGSSGFEELDFNLAFELLERPVLNDAGDFAFVGTPVGGAKTLYNGSGLAGENPLYESRLVVGDTLAGRVVADLQLSQQAMNGFGTLAFHATFTDGSDGVFLITPVPEPATCLLAALGGALCAIAALRR